MLEIIDLSQEIYPGMPVLLRTSSGRELKTAQLYLPR